MSGTDGVGHHTSTKMLTLARPNYDSSIVCKESRLELKQLRLWRELSLKIGHNVCKIKVKPSAR